MRDRMWVWGATAALTAVLFVACGGGGGGDENASTPRGTTATSSKSSTSTAAGEDMEMTAADFPNIRTLTKVGHYYIGNLLGHTDEALAVARSPDGGRYPVGTLIQLVPQEAMVKRAAGWSPGTNDWEFFSLKVSESGTEILTRGSTPVLNRFGMDCAACHGKAEV
jgi:hypothetical protein